MIITCKSCNTSFNLDDKMLKPTGSKVRCSVCANVFTAFPQQASTPEPPAESHDAEPAAESEAASDALSAAPATFASAGQDAATDADAAEAQTPEADVLEEDAAKLFDDGADLDFALEDEAEDDVSDVEIEDAVSGVLSEELTDVSLEPEPEDDDDLAVIAGLDDDDFSLDASSENADDDVAATVIANLDDDLDLSLDGPPDVAETVIADLDQEDFDLGLPSESDDDSSGTATVIADLDDDGMDLDDLDLTLDMGDDTPPSDAVDAELDELSLDFDLEADADTDESEPDTESDLSVDDDLDLTLDMDDAEAGEMEPAAGLSELEDDLDLSSLESLLMEDDEGDDDAVTMIVDGGEEPELKLEMDDVPALDGDKVADIPEETLEDLEFDLDADGGDDAADIDLADDGDQEIDLSEIEKMLEEPETESVDLSAVPEQDLDLDIEASLETEKWMSESGDDDSLVKDEELDLSELEQALEDVDTEETDEALEEPELDLDLGDDQLLGTPTETVAVDNELEFDLSDFEEDVPAKAGAEAESPESVDMELEFEVESDSQAEQTLEDEGLEETVAIPEPTADKAEQAPPEPAVTAKPAAAPRPVKKGVSKSLVFLLIVAILGGGGYGTYYMLNQNGIDIPFLSDYLKPKVDDPGNLKLTTFDINSKFIDNASVGKLFVVSGKVKNGYTENRGMITLLGKLFSTGKVPVNQEKVYCGNIMSDLELANLEWDKIKARLSNRLGDNRSNVKIEPGKSIPFMVVFSGLPTDLEEFTIEVTGSTTLK
ncbi:zinc-ribbon domain-containing protein [Desulfosarcina alkanivorans]|nr:zinc-ribbon domain-containing protein [Desulfosarcina alkanivorans]